MPKYCMCGADERGGVHDALCPYPEYSGDTARESAWMAARRALRSSGGNLSDVQQAMERAAQKMIVVLGNPLNYASWTLYLLETLDSLTTDDNFRPLYERMLCLLRDDLETRINTGNW